MFPLSDIVAVVVESGVQCDRNDWNFFHVINIGRSSDGELMFQHVHVRDY